MSSKDKEHINKPSNNKDANYDLFVKRRHLYSLHRRYMDRRIKYSLPIILISTFGLIIVSVFGNLDGLSLIMTILLWLIIIIIILALTTKKINFKEMEQHVQEKFDNFYGQDEYKKTMELINEKK